MPLVGLPGLEPSVKVDLRGSQRQGPMGLPRLLGHHVVAMDQSFRGGGTRSGRQRQPIE